MAYNPANNAYDLSLFEPKRSPYVSVRQEATARKKNNNAAKGRTGTRKTINAPEKEAVRESKLVGKTDRANLVQWLVIGIVLIVVVSVLISSRVEHHELTLQIDEASSRLELLKQDYEALRVSFDTKMSDTAVEEYAVKTLGMQKRENSQTEYISLGTGDIFEIADEQSLDWYNSGLEELLSYMK